MWPHVRCVSAALAVTLVGVASAACVSPLATAPAGEDVVIAASQFGQTIDLKIGQTLTVRRPADFSAWQIDYSSDVLQALTLPDQMRSPGPDGWRFKAIASGETDITLTPIVQSDPNNPAPQPAPPRFSVTIRVR